MNYGYKSDDGMMDKDKCIIFLYTPDDITDVTEKGRKLMFANALNGFKAAVKNTDSIAYHSWDEWNSDNVRTKVK